MSHDIAAADQADLQAVPNQRGRFGDYGGRFVPETLTRALDELAEEYEKARNDSQFQNELQPLGETVSEFSVDERCRARKCTSVFE